MATMQQHLGLLCVSSFNVLFIMEKPQLFAMINSFGHWFHVFSPTLFISKIKFYLYELVGSWFQCGILLMMDGKYLKFFYIGFECCFSTYVVCAFSWVTGGKDWCSILTNFTSFWFRWLKLGQVRWGPSLGYVEFLSGTI